MDKRVYLNGADEKAVSEFWRGLSSEAYDNVLADCSLIRCERDLCDWAYFKMTETVAGTLYDTRNERSVFHAWLLAQSGIKVRLGRENDNIHLLTGTGAMLFGKPFWTLKDGTFFLLDDDTVMSMYIMDVEFPSCAPLRMRMKAANAFDKDSAPARQLGSTRYPGVHASVACDKNTLAFLQDVPIAALDGTDDTDFVIYANMPISENARVPLYSSLERQIAGKTQADAANIILNFVQTAFEYKTDEEVWGRERPLFPEETLYYPYSDCEDRAILFCRLIRDLMGLDVALVSYPGHLATAVHFTQNVCGDFFIVDSKKYLVCDPTYINAPIGCTMPGMNNHTAQVYLM